MSKEPAPTAQELSYAVDLVVSVAAIIREHRSVPSGHLYVAMSASQFTRKDFDSVVRVLKDMELVRESGHILTWIGEDSAIGGR